MTSAREIRQQMKSLGDIRDITNSMKILAFMETQKLSRFVGIQQQLVVQMEETAADFLDHFPHVNPPAAMVARAYVLIGSERGFCGDFNARLASWVARKNVDPAVYPVIAVGRRLVSRLQADGQRVIELPGASTNDEVVAVQASIIEAIAKLQRAQGTMAMDVVYHGNHNDVQDGLRERRILPPFGNPTPTAGRFGLPPLLNLPPRDFFALLLNQYLPAVLLEVLYTSLMAENRTRLQHLDSAINHLDDKQIELGRRRRELRQEQIIEEIEVILLSSEGVGTP